MSIWKSNYTAGTLLGSSILEQSTNITAVNRELTPLKSSMVKNLRVNLYSTDSTMGGGKIWGIPSHYPPAARDTLLDFTYNVQGYDSNGNRILPPMGGGKISGDILNRTIIATAIKGGGKVSGLYVNGIIITGCVVKGGSIIKGDPYLIPKGDSWVKWSKIGTLDFTADKTNESGSRPMDWKGFAWCVKKFKNKVIVYGQNGISVLTPVGANMAMETIHRIGLKGKNAIAGTDNVHFFVDNLGQLWKLSDGLKLLDYSEYLASTTSNLSLFHDNANDLLYLCDGVKGFLYCDGSQSFGKGPISITGIDSQSGVLYVTSPTAITTPTFEICTDIYDFGTRKSKNIVSIEFGTDVVTNLQASVDYRLSKSLTFLQTPWYNVDSKGMVYIGVYGEEFRFRLKSNIWEYFELDYINVNMRTNDN